MNTWYQTLERPPLTPPSWVFSPVWAVLYATIVVAIFLYYRSHPGPRWRWTTVVLAFHLLTNFLWTALFFGLKSPGYALADIVLLVVSLGVVLRLFWTSSRASSILLVPYLLWVLFATYLNAGFFWLNGHGFPGGG